MLSGWAGQQAVFWEGDQVLRIRWYDLANRLNSLLRIATAIEKDERRKLSENHRLDEFVANEAKSSGAQGA